MAPPLTISRRDFCAIWLVCPAKAKRPNVYKKLSERFDLRSLTCDQIAFIKKEVDINCSTLTRLWEAVRRDKSKLLNQDWVLKTTQILLLESTRGHVRNPRGRPSKPLSECSKKYRSAKARKETSEVNSISIIQQSISILKTRGFKYVASMVNLCLDAINNPELIGAVPTAAPKLSADEAVALISDCDLSVNHYKRLTQFLSALSIDLFPSYYSVNKEKLKCYPPARISDKSARIPMRNVLRFNAKRLLKALDYSTDKPLNLVMTSKVGSDGSGGHSTYKQGIRNGNVGADSKILAAFMVPLKLQLIMDDGQTTDIWINPRPNSTRLCTPISLRFIPENQKTIRAVTKRILTSTPSIIDSVQVTHKLFNSMCDGKTHNSIEGVASQACYCCNLSGEALNFPPTTVLNITTIERGVSPLHARLRSLDFFLSEAYKIRPKAEIQNLFADQLHLMIDFPKAGFGTSNDGNSSRAFFKNYSITAEITGIPEDLIRRFHDILNLLYSSTFIDPIKLRALCLETADILRETFPNRNFTPTIHRILFHSSDIVSYFNDIGIPIGWLSEEPIEGCNKLIRSARDKHARKCTRVKNITDCLRKLNVNSDHYVNKFRRDIKKRPSVYNPATARVFREEPDVHMDVDNFLP